MKAKSMSFSQSTKRLLCVAFSVAAVVAAAVGTDGADDFTDESSVVAGDGGFLFGSFPEDFAWGASSAAFRVEGGWSADGMWLSFLDLTSGVDLDRLSLTPNDYSYLHFDT